MTKNPEDNRSRGNNPGGWTDREGVDQTEKDRRENDPQARGERRDERAPQNDREGERGDDRQERGEPRRKSGETKSEKPTSS